MRVAAGGAAVHAAGARGVEAVRRRGAEPGPVQRRGGLEVPRLRGGLQLPVRGGHGARPGYYS